LLPQQIKIPFERTRKAWSLQTVTALLSLVSPSTKEDYEAEVASLIASSIEEASIKLRLMMKEEHPRRRDVETYKAELEHGKVTDEAVVGDVSENIKIRA
jgi:hypothetical protein